MKNMNDLEIERHIIRAVYELELIRDEYNCHKKDSSKKLECLDDIIETLKYHYPNVEEELNKETWK